VKTVRVIAVVALAFLSITAILGANFLMQNPMGRPMDVPVSLLQHSPFHSFFVPGIILLVSNGLLPLAITVATASRKDGYGRWIAFQGCVLFGWITIEVLMLRTVVWLHYVYWGLALILIATGWALRREPGRFESTLTHPLPEPSAIPPRR
jgi:hypothetical protein